MIQFFIHLLQRWEGRDLGARSARSPKLLRCAPKDEDLLAGTLLRGSAQGFYL